MKRTHRIVNASLIILFMLGALAWKGEYAIAQSPDRETTITVPYTEYEWWLIRFTDGAIVCAMLVDHEGLPATDEVLRNCGEEVYTQWVNTPPCAELLENQGQHTQCPGLYLYLASFQHKERQVVVELPPPTVYVELQGCTPTPPENLCPEIPELLLVGEEPLPNEQIIFIHGFFGNEPFTCEGSSCALPLRTTGMEGILVEFWAESSFGDFSERYTAQVRVIDSGVTDAPEGGGFYVDVISSQWRGAELASCVRIWEVFPPVGAAPKWLSTPNQSELMASDEPYFYLAGRLIAQGVVDASECSTGGLLPNGYADACGLEKARPIVDEWQNQFDNRIIEVANETGVPAQLMKNLFAQESQFWPGLFRVPYEYGLGQITDNGADSLLLWNDSFFEQFCPLVLTEDSCSGGYLHLQDEYRMLLRGAVALMAKADCEDCPAGIDLSTTEFSISLFANTLKANCSQVGQIVFNATNRVAGSVSDYEDLWRFTVANYHAGPGCLSYAIHVAWQGTDGKLTWERVAPNFTEACRGVVPYVEKITDINQLRLSEPTAQP